MDDGADLAGLRVLIVEDECLLALELETLLQQCGCMVLGSASSISKALATLEHEQPEIALLDVNLRGECVTPVAAALQARSVPFVLITGYSAGQLNQPELRVAPRIDKPVRWRALKHAITRAVDDGTPGVGLRSAACRRLSPIVEEVTS